MPIQTAAGYPQYSGGVIPSVVRAGKILKNFYLSTVYGAICNTDYEGDISEMGDKVEIVGEPDITVRDYKKGESLTYENPEPPVQNLLIDRAKYWAFKIDNIDKFQSDHNYLDNWSTVAGLKLKIAVDAQVCSGIYGYAGADNSGATAGASSGNVNLGTTGSPLALTKSNVLEWIAGMGQVLDETYVPDTDRALVIPPWVSKLIKISEFKDATIAGDNTSMLRNGRLGIIDRFTLYQSNNVTKTTDGGDTTFEPFACHKSAVSFAAQITEHDVLKAESTFGTLARGLLVYGWKVVKPEGLAHAHVKQGAAT